MNKYLALLRAKETPTAGSAPGISAPTVTIPAVTIPAATTIPANVTPAVLCLDFETFFSPKDGCTLKKLTTEAYIRDPRFAAICLGYAYLKNDAVVSGWVAHAEIARFLGNIDWAETSVLAHHAHFDGLILSHHGGVYPRYWFDTLSMARVLYPSAPADLEALAAKFGCEPKIVPYDEMAGVCPNNMGSSLAHDCEITLRLFQKLKQDFPPEELDLIDITVQMFASPRIIGRIDKFTALAEADQRQTAAATASLGVQAGDLRSAPRLQALLEAEGIEVETKAGKRGPIPCFALTFISTTAAQGAQAAGQVEIRPIGRTSHVRVNSARVSGRRAVICW